MVNYLQTNLTCVMRRLILKTRKKNVAAIWHEVTAVKCTQHHKYMPHPPEGLSLPLKFLCREQEPWNKNCWMIPVRFLQLLHPVVSTGQMSYRSKLLTGLLYLISNGVRDISPPPPTPGIRSEHFLGFSSPSFASGQPRIKSGRSCTFNHISTVSAMHWEAPWLRLFKSSIPLVLCAWWEQG